MAGPSDIESRAAGMPAAGPRRTRLLVLAFLFSAAWSAAFIAGKFGLQSAPPLLLLSLRFLLAGPILLAAAWLVGGVPRWDRRTLVLACLLGLLNQALYLGLSFSGLQTVTAGLVVVIASTTPLLTNLLARVLLGERLTGLKVLGLALGFGGVLFIMRHRIGLGSDDPSGMVLVVLATLSFSLGTILFTRLPVGTGLLAVNGVQHIAGGLALLPVALVLEDPADVQVDLRLVLALGYLVLVASVGAGLLWLHLIRIASAGVASSFHFLNPALGVLFGWLLLGEPVSGWDLLGAVPVALGILLVTRSAGGAPEIRAGRPRDGRPGRGRAGGAGAR